MSQEKKKKLPRSQLLAILLDRRLKRSRDFFDSDSFNSFVYWVTECCIQQIHLNKLLPIATLIKKIMNVLMTFKMHSQHLRIWLHTPNKHRNICYIIFSPQWGHKAHRIKGQAIGTFIVSVARECSCFPLVSLLELHSLLKSSWFYLQPAPVLNSQIGMNKWICWCYHIHSPRISQEANWSQRSPHQVGGMESWDSKLAATDIFIQPKHCGCFLFLF